VITNSGATRVYWTGSEWHVQIEHAIDPRMRDNIIAYLRPIQVQRLRGRPLGDVRDDCERSIAALDAKRIVQVFAGRGEKVLHDAYSRSHT
jgi:hypothetical protein